MKNKMKLRTAANMGLLLCSTAFLTSCGDGTMEVVQTISEEYAGIKEIQIESGFLEVIYEGIEGQDEVLMTGTLESTRPGSYRLEYYVEGDVLEIELDQKNLIGSGRHQGVLYITGPTAMELDVESGSGIVRISNVQGDELDFDAGSGVIELYRVSANEIDAEVGSGTIKGFDLEGKLLANAGSGRLEFDDVLGDAELNVSSGVIRLKNLSGALNSQISSGNLHMERVNEIQNLRVSSGSIEGTEIGIGGANTVLTCSSGRIRLQTYSDFAEYNFSFQAGSGRVRVGDSSSSGSLEINNGSAVTVKGSVSSGSIEIYN
ncbi:DUF4097 family beta strand repeat-containing protein [Algoriphagus vanfongensis]|uniref:DUF4097 family beta strand repeat-containing protein n=1 Tax=Algoriphagus vanfongensis TaxID=426371 RepID=UPI0003FED8CC|nr:DUF4097 family beta strand repeat-containing protein [Algoriphagus vanfongensis]